MTIIHVACAGVEHIGRVKGNSWKKAKKRQMLILEDAVRVFPKVDQQGQSAGRLLASLKKQGYQGTVLITLSSHYPCYIWIVKPGENLYQVYKQEINPQKPPSTLDLPPEKRIIAPGDTRKPPTPMGPRMKH